MNPSPEDWLLLSELLEDGLSKPADELEVWVNSLHWLIPILHTSVAVVLTGLPLLPANETVHPEAVSARLKAGTAAAQMKVQAIDSLVGIMTESLPRWA